MIRIYDMTTGSLLETEHAQPVKTLSRLGRSTDVSHPTLQLQEIELKSTKASTQMPHDLATKSIDSFILQQK